MIVLDANALVKLTVDDPQSDDDALRLQGLLARAEAGGIVVGIPAPAFAEFLVRADDATVDILSAFERKSLLRVLPFDKRAAHECALLDRFALAAGNKKGGARSAWQKIKIDRQIIAIARVHGAQEIVTNDGDLTTLANRVGLKVSSVSELPIPDDGRQRGLDLTPKPEE